MKQKYVGGWRRRAYVSERRIVEVKEQIKWKKNSLRRSADDVEEKHQERRIDVEEVKKI
jgi:hypothetical protein